MKKTLQEFVKNHKYQWWWVEDVTFLSDVAVVEGTMNYGQWEDKLNIIKLMGPKKTKQIFTELVQKPRSNIRPEVADYWTDYLNTHYPHA